MAEKCPVLSAKELMAIRLSKTKPKAIPVTQPKEFTRTYSDAETEHIRSMIAERMSFIEEERAERRDHLSKAEWIEEKSLAKVVKEVGVGWNWFGFKKDGHTCLLAEEALFLLETNKLEISYGGSPISVQQAFALLLKPKNCPPNQYHVYSHLSRLGYRVRRQEVEPSLTAKRRNESRSDSQLAPPVKKVCENPQSHLHKVFVAEPNLLDSIPDFSKNRVVQLFFDDLGLIPEPCRNRAPLVTCKMEAFSAESKPVGEPSRSAVNMADDVNPLFAGATKPLLSRGCGDLQFDDILSRLRIFQRRDVNGKSNGADLSAVYDVYGPGVAYRKSCPTPAPIRLAVTEWSRPLPTPSSLETLLDPNGKALALVAVTGHGSDVSFYQLRGACQRPR